MRPSKNNKRHISPNLMQQGKELMTELDNEEKTNMRHFKCQKTMECVVQN